MALWGDWPDLAPDFFTAPFYMWGTLPATRTPVAVVATPTANGWRCRSTDRCALQHDYTSRETVDTVRTWIERDLCRADAQIAGVEFTRDRAAFASHLATLASTSGGSIGFLEPDPRLAPDEAAERVLRHLERGW
jgi:hypothetical protein